MTRDEISRLTEAEANRLIRFYEEAEREILDAINRALLRGNKTEYLEAMRDNVRAILDSLRAGSRTWCEEAIPRVYTFGAQEADRQVKAAGVGKAISGFGAIHQQAVKVLAEAAYNRFDEVALTVGRRVDDIYRSLALENVRGSVAGYRTWQEVARNYRNQLAEQGVTGFRDKLDRQWNMRTYSKMVARTTTMECHLEGTKNRLLEHGYDLVKVSSHAGSCPLCLPYQGKILSLTGRDKDDPRCYATLQEAKDNGLFHPNCVPAGVLVTGPTPLASFSRWYEGELVIIQTASGVELSVTPNHPILTPKGWIAAGLLMEGDDVVRYLGQQGVMEGVDPDDYQVPTLIEDIACSLGESRGVSPICVPVAPEDFHGDGKGSKVCVVRADGLLRDNVDASLAKPCRQNDFGLASRLCCGLFAGGSFGEVLRGALQTSHGVVRCSGQLKAFFGRHSGKAGSHGLRPVGGGLDPKVGETPLDGDLINAEALGDSLLGLSALVTAKNIIAIEGNATSQPGLREISNGDIVLCEDLAESLVADMEGGLELVQRLARSIAVDEIINIARRQFSGHVYNLQTTEGWYACNTIITHNCRHTYSLHIDLDAEIADLEAESA